jgi:phosphatidylglycerol lysyltransferase
MKTALSFKNPVWIFGETGANFIRENGKLITQFFLTVLFFGLGIWFLKHEQAELHQVKQVLLTSRLSWLIAGIMVTVIYILLQGLMYVTSFRSVGVRATLWDTLILFLKRNFISVFLPAGGVSSLAFFTGDLEKKGISKSQIHFASTIYGFVGILSVIIVAIPAFIYGILEGNTGSGEWFALLAVIALLTLFYLLYRSLSKRTSVYRLLIKLAPASEVFLEDISSNKVDRFGFVLTVIISSSIEICGITHLYIAMKALQFEPSIFAAVMGYIIAVVFMIVSPFLRGLGAVEVSMAFILTRFGFSNVESIAITLFYRFLEFWLPLLTGILAFLSKINKLLFRIIPPLLIFLLGLINIISVITPAAAERVERLQEFLLVDAIRASNYFVLAAGLFLLITAAFMLKGLRSAWWMGVFLSFGSLIGHLAKAIDYEEAIVALLVIIILIITRKEYYVKNSPRLRSVGIQTAIFSILAVLIYGTVGFYLLDKKHFNIDFSFTQSFLYTLQNYFMIGSSYLRPADHFARNFLISINISGFLSIAFFIYTLVRPHVYRPLASLEDMQKALGLIKLFGRSGVDYFKTYPDKMVYLTENENAFASYRITGNFAVVLEDPVAEDADNMKACIRSFERFCFEHGLKDLYYRVPESSLPLYRELGKKSMFVGQEAVVDLNAFTLEGGSRKSMRNALNKVRDHGFISTIHQPPIKDGLLQKLKHVSSEWLDDTGRTEIVFSQGMFSWDELKNQTVITVENPEEKVVAFLNIIPDYAPGEATYDLIRKTADAPNGIMDFILIELFNYLKTLNYQYVNLGFAPMSGINDPHTFTERSMKFAYEKIRSFSHYRGLRDFKEKFEPVWDNKYLIFNQDYDLFQVPSVLSRVIKP